MTSEKKDNRIQRGNLRKQYQRLYYQLAALFLRHDPIGIAFVSHPNVQDNPDEYEPEVGTILPRLQKCSTESDCLKIIHEEFCRWFGEDVAGSIADYKIIAHETWVLWNEEKLNSNKPQLQ
jgi:hypothetical protein